MLNVRKSVHGLVYTVATPNFSLQPIATDRDAWCVSNFWSYRFHPLRILVRVIGSVGVPVSMLIFRSNSLGLCLLYFFLLRLAGAMCRLQGGGCQFVHAQI